MLKKRNAAHRAAFLFRVGARGRDWFFMSKFVSKIITFLFCTSQNYSPYRKFIFAVKTAQTRMNTRKTRNHKGCGFSSFVVGVGGLEPPASWSRTKRATSCATPRQPFHYRRSCPRCQGKFTTHCHLAGSNMYLQGAELREEALCPANFIQRKGVQR